MILIYNILTLFCILTTNDIAAENISDYDRWMKLNSSELIGRADRCLKNGSVDSALVFYSIVSNRTSIKKEENMLRCKAYSSKAMIYFEMFSDYSKAFENLFAAMDINNSSNLGYYVVDKTASIFYHVVAVTCRDWEMERKAMNLCNKAYDIVLAQGNRRELGILVTNITVMSCNLNDIENLDNIWKTYKEDSDTTYSYKFNYLFYYYLKNRLDGKLDEAIRNAREMIKISTSNNDRNRMIMSYNGIVEGLEKKGSYEEAIRYLSKQEELVKKWNMRENAIEILNIKERLLRKIGKEDIANKYSRMYYMKKDSLFNIKQANSIANMMHSDKNRKMEQIITEMTVKNDIYEKMVLIVLLFVIVLLMMVIMLRIKIKELKKSNITIYENNQENIKNEEKNRKKLKDEVLKLEQNIPAPEVSIIESSEKEDENVCEQHNEIQNTNESIVTEEEKYKNNYLTEDEKKKLLDKILTVMEDVDEICSESFSGKRLAELTGSSYNYVSQVINENYGCNFNNFLNKFRIKEACRRLSDQENYGNYTIDYISNSLGFKSRTTLITSFKKIVGLTPSQYRSIAKEKEINDK